MAIEFGVNQSSIHCHTWKEMNMFSLTTTHLRFVCEATTPLRLEADIFRAGSNLRGALGQVMLRSYCAHPHQDPKGSLARAAGQDERGENLWGLCPVHWLLAANEKPGEERRGYALVPPLPHDGAECLNRGDAFEFGITLFGNAQKFLPYFILAVPEMGRAGIGPGRGKFELKRVWALNPLTGESEILFGDSGNLVRTPTVGVNHEMVMRNAECRMRNRETGDWRLEIDFLTPTRLIEADRLAQAPEFAVLFARLLKRLDDLNEQFGDGSRRGGEAAMALQRVAEQVRLAESHTRWVEVWSGSTRRGQSSPLSGIVGFGRYEAAVEVWRELLPWLLWGELAQVGKAAVKGNGVMRIKDEEVIG
ncbi:MAG: hypothetical protein B6D41_02060 [Chloroflexi bacterium UTCFX4]|nr:MAG: hypothetical protein B6D41_02060 [Chloroflexi bacterium UTCFX4]